MATNCLQPTGWTERLWLPASALVGGRGDQAHRLWLLLDDGRVLVFALPSAVPDDRYLDALAAAVADDVRGDLLSIDLAGPVPVNFQVLHGAPASPMLCVGPNSPLLADVMLFHAVLDVPVLAALQRMVGAFTFWASARNYNRLAAHAARERRLQALQRFPLLVAPILLSRQRWFNLDEAKRYRWRAHDADVVAAIEQGRDLVGALARCYGISRGLVRSPFCAEFWVGHSGHSLAEFLQFLDAIPAHRRPSSGREVDAVIQHLPAFWRLFEPDWRRSADAFRAGFSPVWRSVQSRFTPVNESLTDAIDFLNVQSRWLRANYQMPMTRSALSAQWVRVRGLPSLLEASRRWHRRLPPRGGALDGYLPATVPAILGHWHSPEPEVAEARELLTYAELADEGDAMCHCVADYWEGCMLSACRVFALHRVSADQQERATAFYEPVAEGYVLTQLRGPSNALVGSAMQQCANALVTALNADELAGQRLLALQVARVAREARFQPAPAPAPEVLDDDSIVALRTLLKLPDVPVINDIPANLADPVCLPLCLPVAGYAFYASPEREALLAPGQPVTLVREPDNPHDSDAVRIDWQGEKIGYVPRDNSAACAALLDTGRQITASISAFWPQADPLGAPVADAAVSDMTTFPIERLWNDCFG